MLFFGTHNIEKMCKPDPKTHTTHEFQKIMPNISIRKHKYCYKRGKNKQEIVMSFFGYDEGYLQNAAFSTNAIKEIDE